MGNIAITFQQANTESGEYDPRQSKPYPVTAIRVGRDQSAYIGHPTNPGATLGGLLGFTRAGDEGTVLFFDGLPDDAADLIGLRPVYAPGDEAPYTDLRPIERIVSTVPDGA